MQWKLISASALLALPVSTSTLASDHFLTYPFEDSGVKVQQGWIYSWDPSLAHKGIDYIKGTIDQSSTWQSFDVNAAADGHFICSWSDTWGNYGLGEHHIDDTTYYTVYAHLEECDFSSADLKAGDRIGRSGSTGSASNGVLHLHFESSVEGWGSQCGCKVDPYDINSTRDHYPEFGGSCGANYLWTSCPPTWDSWSTTPYLSRILKLS